jgi:hypothetical protein
MLGVGREDWLTYKTQASMQGKVLEKQLCEELEKSLRYGVLEAGLS